MKGNFEELKKFIKDVQREANISGYKISPFMKRIEEFKHRKEPNRKDISKTSVREKLKANKENISKTTTAKSTKKELEL